MSVLKKPGIFFSFGLLFVLAIGSYFISSCTRSEKPTVAITQIVSHPSLDEIRKGIIEALDERGYRDGKNIVIIYRNANGDPSLT
ncbi:MAG: peptide ABC transporter substrate-binding protein, partial [Deltaproteobacteria bacterium]|nr:peptide ABC transporter substrate-binding protein [Deltaproteobacteria bacterium]